MTRKGPAAERRDGTQPSIPSGTPKVDRKDIAAMIIALFQLFAPLVLALALVGVILGVILRCAR
mgnify:CR=1 FL=1